MAMNEGEKTNVDADKIYTLHLFAGAGGGILGDLLLGHIPVGAVEIEAYPRKVLLARQLDGSLPRFPIWDDVCTFRSDNPDTASYIERLRGIRDRLCICGGFPCQDISCAGKGAGIEGARSGLWREFSRIIGEIRPAYVFVENSPMLLIRGFGRVAGDLAAMGYDARWGVLGHDNCGGQHSRKRVWIIANRDKRVVFSFSKRNCKNKQRREKEVRRKCWIDFLVEDDGVFHQKWRCNEAGINSRPIMRGSSDGLAGGMDRINAIGNGQCPQVVKLAWEVLR